MTDEMRTRSKEDERHLSIQLVKVVLTTAVIHFPATVILSPFKLRVLTITNNKPIT